MESIYLCVKTKEMRLGKRSGIRTTSAIILCFLLPLAIQGCAISPGTGTGIQAQKPVQSYKAGDIIDTKSNKIISFETLMSELAAVQIVFVGEQHTNPDHHNIQLRIMEALVQEKPALKIGMEMFDRSYQPLLDQWSAGSLERQAFIEKTHWYANWRYNYDLYADILDAVKKHRLPLLALNIPFDIPAKISVGGIHNLSPEDSRYLPKEINTGNAEHRDYLKDIYDKHNLRGRENFEYFYSAQCVWEDAMAEVVAEYLSGGDMLVLAGNGHIVKKFGIPDRAAGRTGASYLTVYPLTEGLPVDISYADYLWITPKKARKSPRIHS